MNIYEEWACIKGYEEIYQVSTLGRVRRISNQHILVPRIHKGNKSKGDNLYRAVSLWKNGKGKEFLIHRLVADAFIPNPANKKVVNHINGIKSDNRIENLEWVTYKENSRHAFTNGMYDNRSKMMSKPVIAKDLCGHRIALYASITAASEASMISASNIVQCCKGRRKTAGGYRWEYI